MGKSLKIEFLIKPVYNEQYLKYLKTKINVYTDFFDNKISKKNPQYICLSVILLDSAFAIGKYYYRRVFLEKCKYVIKEKKFKNIFDDIEISSDSDY